MPPDVTSPELTLAIVGAGVMGRGIARVAAQAGVRVLLHDAIEGVAAQAVVDIHHAMQVAVQKGRLTTEAAGAAMACLQPVSALSELRNADVVIEAIVEDLPAKHALFSALEEMVSTTCVLATNTSSLSVTAIAAACQAPQRVLGVHFFNPVPQMKLVEVIDGARGDPAVGDAMMALIRRIGHTPVRVRDTPGFLVNHAGRGFGTEALRMLAEGIAEPPVIDAILRGQAGFRLGPFELLDLVGLDVAVPVMESVYRQFWDEPRFRPSPLLVQRRAAGLLGAKSGEGFYRYQDGRRITTPVAAPVRVPTPPIWISAAEPVLAESARVLLAGLGATIETDARPSAAAICVVTPVGEDVTTCAVRQQLDATRTVALDLLFSNATQRVLMLSPVTTGEVRAQMESLLGSDGVGVGTIHDSAGLVTQRVVALIVNIACDIAQQGIAAPADIDLAVTLGLGYPRGPLAWGDALGASTVARILTRLHALSGDPRYRLSPWLRRRADLGLSLLHTATT
ncbi:MAG: 3-hydroxyacyl-CoA dehydrogenase [Gemmatimonadota bacterium]